MIESQVFKEWTDLARIAGLKEGKKEGKIESLLLVLGLKGTVPPGLDQVIRSIANSARLDDLFLLAGSSATIDDFRRAAGL